MCSGSYAWRVAAFAVGVLVVGVSVGPACADPGVAREQRMGEMAVTDPVVDRVRIALRRELRDSVFTITVLNTPDVVILQGEVDSQETRTRAVSVAHAASGKRVRDEMRLRPAPTDDQISSQVRSILSQEYPDIASRIQVDVKGGVAYLSGDLRNHREVDELLATTLMVSGVRDVRSDITLSGRPYAGARMRVGRR